jgi:putative selenate reductase
MSDKFYRISIEQLFNWILAEEKEGRIFGLYKELLFTPHKDDPFRMMRYGQLLETPIGVAAGPHTQLAHNIIASWLCGARYLELKTVQTLDEIEVKKPCIDMEDEGYNCEWSQELKVYDSFDEYLNAWILIHILKHKFGWDETEPGFIFNISVGYDLEGILKPNVQWFLDKMNNCKDELDEKIQKLIPLYPAIKEINISPKLSDNVTLSTMHGCPPNEIEKIGKYLIEERNLHTAIKLNPTLLGQDNVRHILNEKLGYEVNVPDEAFEHDLKYNDAIDLIKSLQRSADKTGVEFGLKLTNTLESLNSTHWLPNEEKMVYTSGRALHPISINLAARLQKDFDGELDLSFCAGVDVFNIVDTLSCNLQPVTVCSDLLKPGGYLRMVQYFEEIGKKFNENNSNSIDEFIVNKSSKRTNLKEAGLKNLINYAESVLENKVYHKSNFPYENIKTKRELPVYDCIHSPCIDTCDVNQNVPDYMYYTAKGNFEEAYKVILQDNALPNITGNVCDHLCQAKCTRINYDNPLLIRGIKRFISEQFDGKTDLNFKSKNGLKVSIIGAGPSGLSCAYMLALEGFDVDVFESKSFAGGMASGTIPVFRLSDKSIEDDINLIKSIGVKLHFNNNVDKKLFESLQNSSDFVYVAVGAQNSKKLGIPGEDSEGFLDQLTFLANIRLGEQFKLGRQVAVIGGGLSAVDAARTSNRLIPEDGKVTMIYRRTKKEMPVGDDEIIALLEEGIELLELTNPVSISKRNGTIDLKCIKMELGEKDESGRRRPVPIKGSEYVLSFDTVISAIGQEIVLDFLPENKLIIKEGNETQIPNVFAGGDVLRGADSLINAMGDGNRVAQKIIELAKKELPVHQTEVKQKLNMAEFQKKQAYRIFGPELPEIPLEQRKSFDLVHPVLDKDTAMKEAERCLYCEDLCNICIGVCPNFANVSFTAKQAEIPIFKISKNEDGFSSEKVDSFIVKQTNQIFNIGDFCNECGNCNTFCPTSDAPYKTKPIFHLTEESFYTEEKGYYFDNNLLRSKNGNDFESIQINEDKILYESSDIEVVLNQLDFSVRDVIFKNGKTNSVVLNRAAEMYFLLKNLKEFSLFKSLQV